MKRACRLFLIVWLAAAPATFIAQQPTQAGGAPAPDPPEIAARKAAVATRVDGMAKQAQEMVDTVFSFGELGFQEVETSRYLTGILEKNGFAVRREVSNIPTTWVATWGSGSPVIALGSDIDGIPQASQKPGVACRDPLVPGAGVTARPQQRRATEYPGRDRRQADHGSATRFRHPDALARCGGRTGRLEGGLVRDGVFRDVDVCLFAHVGDNFRRVGGRRRYAFSVEYVRGESAHSANARHGGVGARLMQSS